MSVLTHCKHLLPVRDIYGNNPWYHDVLFVAVCAAESRGKVGVVYQYHLLCDDLGIAHIWKVVSNPFVEMFRVVISHDLKATKALTYPNKYTLLMTRVQGFKTLLSE